MAFTTPVDVANRALQHLGIPRISALTNSSKAAREANFAIDKVRQTVLQQSVWTSATRRAVMRPIISTSRTVSFPTYSSATTYAAGDIVADSAGFLWISTVGSNLANTPGAGGVNAKWFPYFGPTVAQVHDTSTTWLPGDVVYVSSTVYLAIAANSNQTPPNATYWMAPTGASISTIVAPWPTHYERDGTTTRNKYKLPSNYLRMAPQDPKFASGVRQNVAAGMQFNDWEVEAGFLMTADSGGFVLRFVADQADVATMEPLLVEVWAAQLAVQLCEPMTQSDEKMNAMMAIYTRFMNTAKLINSVEAGSTEDEPAEAPPSQAQRQGR